MSGYLRSSNYLKIVERAKSEEAPPAASAQRRRVATKATEATKAPMSDVPRSRDKSDRSDKRVAAIALTLQEALGEINREGSGPAKNAELYRRGQLSEEKAVEYVTCAILARRGASFGGWRRHAPTVRKALNLCVHELEPKACKVCNGSAEPDRKPRESSEREGRRRAMDVARQDTVEVDLNRLIVKRSPREINAEERDESWKASVAAYNARRREENRLAWREYHRGQAERHRVILEGLIAEHEAQAEMYALGREG